MLSVEVGPAFVSNNPTLGGSILGLIVASLKERQQSPDVESSSTEAMGAESQGGTRSCILNNKKQL